MKNCLVAQSGGPTVAINATIAGLLSGNNKYKAFDKIYGALHGIEGVMREHFIEFSDERHSDEFINVLKITPAMYLGSCRYKLPKENADSLYEQIFNTFDKYDIDTFFYIGGNDSMDTVAKLSAYAEDKGSDVKIIGLPKTIDNDLVITDHTPGFGSAAKFVASAMTEIYYDSSIYPIKSITVVEIMGRDSGFLTASSILSKNSCIEGPHLAYVPERAFSMEDCIRRTKNLLKSKDSVILAVSEGIRDSQGNYISAEGNTVDEFGHIQLMGVGKILENKLKSEIGIKVRSIELNVLQRCSAHISSKTDIDESFMLGENGIEAATDDISGMMLSLERKSDSPYKVECALADVSEVANQVKALPDEFINKNAPYIENAFFDYAEPLIMGENQTVFKNGVPQYADISHLN